MRSYWSLLLVLAAMWGASYLFIKVGVEDIPPAALTSLRLLLAGLILLAYVVSTMGRVRALAALRAAWRPCLVLGAINNAAPQTLVAWGETHIDSSVAGIAQASVPVFVTLLALRFLPHEPLDRLRATGLALGLGGVALITGIHPEGGWWAVAGTLAVVLSSLLYAGGGVYGQLRVHGAPGPVLATGSVLFGGVLLVPLALADPPSHAPGLAAAASLGALILFPTVIAQLLLFRILASHGSRKLSLVTYLVPGFAVVYGSTILDEPVSIAAIGGLALVLVGVMLASGQRLTGFRARQEPA